MFFIHPVGAFSAWKLWWSCLSMAVYPADSWLELGGKTWWLHIVIYVSLAKDRAGYYWHSALQSWKTALWAVLYNHASRARVKGEQMYSTCWVGWRGEQWGISSSSECWYSIKNQTLVERIIALGRRKKSYVARSCWVDEPKTDKAWVLGLQKNLLELTL